VVDAALWFQIKALAGGKIVDKAGKSKARERKELLSTGLLNAWTRFLCK